MSVLIRLFVWERSHHMELLTEKISTLYRKYLTAAFGSALISSIYGLVDIAMVGRYTRLLSR